ncbi:MAG TPA: hypothetical protein VM408_04115 [Methylomirabilota bacterium]|nr:hypothetical protein [Methylomirabilota bacterium]
MREVGAKSAPGTEPDPFDVAVREIEIAIEMVVSGRARVVQISGLDAAERAAASGLASAQSAGVAFALQRSGSDPGAVTLRIGPRLDD